MLFHFNSSDQFKLKYLILGFTLLFPQLALADSQNTKRMHNELDSLIEANSQKPLVKLHSTTHSQSYQSHQYNLNSNNNYSSHKNYDLTSYRNKPYRKSYSKTANLNETEIGHTNSMDDLKEEVNYAYEQLNQIQNFNQNFANLNDEKQASIIQKANEAFTSIKKISYKANLLANHTNSSQARVLADFANSITQKASTEINQMQKIDKLPNLP